MQLKPETSDALDKWIGRGTWHSGRASDMRRFFRFVAQLWRDHGRGYDDNFLKEEIARRAGIPPEHRENHPLMDTIRSRVKMAKDIQDFLEMTRRSPEIGQHLTLKQRKSGGPKF